MSQTETDRNRIDLLDLIAALAAGRRLIIGATLLVCAATESASAIVNVVTMVIVM